MSTPQPRSAQTQCQDLAALILANFKTILYEARRQPDLKMAVEEAIKHVSIPNPTQATFSNDMLLRPLMMAMNFKLHNTIMPTLAIFQHLLELCPVVRVAQTAISSLSLLVDEQGGGGINPSSVNQNTSYTTGNVVQDDKIYVKILQCVLLAVTPTVLSDQEGLRSCFITALSICCKLSHKPRGMIQSTALAAVRHLIQLIFDVANQDLTEQQFWTKYPFPHDRPPRHGQTALTTKLEQKKQMDEMTTHDMYLDDQLQSALREFSDDSTSETLSNSSSLCSVATSFLSHLSVSNVGGDENDTAKRTPEVKKITNLSSRYLDSDETTPTSLSSSPETPKNGGNKQLQQQQTPLVSSMSTTGTDQHNSSKFEQNRNNGTDDGLGSDDDTKSGDDDVVATHSNSSNHIGKEPSTPTNYKAKEKEQIEKSDPEPSPTTTQPTIPPKLSPLSPALSLALTIFSELCLTARSFLGNSTSSLQRVKSLVTPFVSTLQPLLCLELIHNIITKHNHIFISIPYFTRILSTDVLTTILEIISCDNSQLVIWGIKIASVLLLHYGGIPSLTAQGELLATILSRQIYYTSSIPVLLAILDLYQSIASNARPLLILREVYDGSSTESTATTSATSISPVVYMFVKSIGALTLHMLELLCDNRIKLLPSSLRNDNLEFNSYTLPPTRSSEVVLNESIAGQNNSGGNNGAKLNSSSSQTRQQLNTSSSQTNDLMSKFNDTQPLNQPYNAAQLFSAPYSCGVVNGVDLWDVRRAIVNQKTVPADVYGTPLHVLCVCLEILMAFCHTLSSLTQNLNRYEDYILPTFDALVRESHEEEEQKKKLAELDLVVAGWKDKKKGEGDGEASGELVHEKSAEFALDDFMSPAPGAATSIAASLQSDSESESDGEMAQSVSSVSARSARSGTSSVASTTSISTPQPIPTPFSHVDANGESIFGSIGDGYHVRCVTRLTRDLLQGEHTTAAFSFLTKFMSDLGYGSLTPSGNESALPGSPSLLTPRALKQDGTPAAALKKAEDKNASIQPHYLSIMSCLSSLLTTPIIPTRRSLQSLLELLAPTLISAFHFTATYLKHQQLVQFCLLGLQSLVNVSVSLNGDGHILLADPNHSGTIIRKRIPSLVHSNSPTGNNPMHEITKELIIALCSLSLPIFDYSELLYLKTQYTMFGCNAEETLSSATGMYKYRATYKQPHGVIANMVSTKGKKQHHGVDEDAEMIDIGGEDIQVSSTMNNQSIQHTLLVESVAQTGPWAAGTGVVSATPVTSIQQNTFTNKDAIWPPKAYGKTLSMDYMATVYEFIAPDIAQSVLSRLESADIPLTKPLTELAIFSPSQYVLPHLQQKAPSSPASPASPTDKKSKKGSKTKQSNHDLEYYPPPIPRHNVAASQNNDSRTPHSAFGQPTLADFFRCLSLNFCHIAALKAVLNAAHVYGRELGQGWVPILHTLTRAYSISQIWQSQLFVSKPVTNTPLDITTYIASQTVGELGAIVLATKALIDKNIKSFTSLASNPINTRLYTHDNHYKQYTKLAKIKAQRLFHLVFDENQNLVELDQAAASPSEPHTLTLSPTVNMKLKSPQFSSPQQSQRQVTYPALMNHIIEIDPTQSYLSTDLHFNHIFHSLLLVNDLLHNRHILSLRPNPNITPVSWNIDHTNIVTTTALSPTQLLLPTPPLLPGNDFGPSSVDSHGNSNPQNQQQHSMLSPFADRINTFPLAFLLELVETTYESTYLNPFIIFVRNVLMRLIYSDHHFTQRIGILFCSRLVCRVLKVEATIFSSKTNIFGVPNTSAAAPIQSRQSIFGSKSTPKQTKGGDSLKSPLKGANGTFSANSTSTSSSSQNNSNAVASPGSMFLDASLYYYGKYSRSSVYLSPAAHDRIHSSIKASKSVGGVGVGVGMVGHSGPSGQDSHQFSTPVKPRRTPRVQPTPNTLGSLQVHEGHSHHAASGSAAVSGGKKDVIKGFGYTACDIFCYALASLCSPQPLQWYNHSATNVLSTVVTPTVGNGNANSPFTAIPSMMLDCALYALNCMSTVIDHCGGFINNNWLALLSPLSCSIAMLQQQQLYQQQLVMLSLPKDIIKKQSQYNNMTNQISYGNSYGKNTHLGSTTPELETAQAVTTPQQQPVVQQSSDVLMTARFKVVQLICDDYLDIIPLSYIPYIINIVSTYAQQFISINTAFVSVHQLWRLSDYIQQTCDAQHVNKQILLKLIDSLLYLHTIAKDDEENQEKQTKSSKSLLQQQQQQQQRDSIDIHHNVDYSTHPALFTATLSQQQGVLPQNETTIGSTPSITRARTTTHEANAIYTQSQSPLTNPAANMITRLSITNTCNFPSLPYFYQKYMTFAPSNVECQHEIQPLQTHIISQIHSLLYNTTSNSNLAAQSPAVGTRSPNQGRKRGGNNKVNDANAVIVELLDPADEFSLASPKQSPGPSSPLDDISAASAGQIAKVPEFEPLPPPGESGIAYASQLSNTSLQLLLAQMLGHEGLYHHHHPAEAGEQPVTPTNGGVGPGAFRGSLLPTVSSNLSQILEVPSQQYQSQSQQQDCSTSSHGCQHTAFSPQQQSLAVQQVLEKQINYTKLSHAELATHSSALQTLRESIYDYISSSIQSMKQYRKQWKLENPDAQPSECPIVIPSTYDSMTAVLNDLKYIVSSTTSLFEVPFLEPSSPLSTMTKEENETLFTTNQQRGLYNVLTTFMHTPSYHHSTQLHRNNVQSYHDTLLYYIYYHFNFILRSNHTEIRHTAIKTLYKCFEEHFPSTTPIMLEFTMMTLIVPYTMYVIPDTLVVHCENTTFPQQQGSISPNSAQNFSWKETKILAIQGLTQLLNPLLLSLSKRCYLYNTTPSKNAHSCIHHQSYDYDSLFVPQGEHYDYQLITYQNPLFALSRRQNSIPSNILNVVSHLLLNVLHHHNVDLAMATAHSIQLLFNSQYLMRCVEFDNTNQLLYTILNLLSLYCGWVQRTAVIYSLTYIHSTAKDMGETLFQSIKAQYYPTIMGYEHILFTHPAQQRAQWILFHENVLQQNTTGQNYSVGNATLGIPTSLIDIVYYTNNLSDRCIAWYSVAVALLDFAHHIIKQPTAVVAIPGQFPLPSLSTGVLTPSTSPRASSISFNTKSGKVSIDGQNRARITTPLKQLALAIAKDIVSCEYLIPFVSTLNSTFINSVCVRPNNDTSMLQNIYLYTLKDALGFGTAQATPATVLPGSGSSTSSSGGSPHGTPVQKPSSLAQQDKVIPPTAVISQSQPQSQQTPPLNPLQQSPQHSELDLILIATVFECIASHLTSRPLQQYQSLGIYIDDVYKPGLAESYFNHPIIPLPSAPSASLSSSQQHTPRFAPQRLPSGADGKTPDFLQAVAKSYPFNLVSMGIPLTALQPHVDGADPYELTSTTPLCPVYFNTVPQHMYQYNNSRLQPQIQFPYPCVSWLLLSGQSYVAKLLTLTQAFLLSKIPSGLSLTQQASYQQQSPQPIAIGETGGIPSVNQGQGSSLVNTHNNNSAVVALLPNNFTSILPTTPAQRQTVMNGQYLGDASLYSILFSYIRLFYPVYQKLLYICFTSNISHSATVSHHTTDNGQQFTASSPTNSANSKATTNTNNLFSQLSTITLASNSYTRVTATHPLLRQLILKTNTNPAGTALPQQTASGAMSPALPTVAPSSSSSLSSSGKFQFDTFYFLPIINSLYINIESVCLFVSNFWPVFYQQAQIPTHIHVFKSHNVSLPLNIIHQPIVVYEAINAAMISKSFYNNYQLQISDNYTLPFLYTTYHIYNQLLNITTLPLPYYASTESHKLDLCIQQLYVVISNGIVMCSKYLIPLWLRAQLDIFQFVILLSDALTANNNPHYVPIYANYAPQHAQQAHIVQVDSAVSVPASPATSASSGPLSTPKPPSPITAPGSPDVNSLYSVVYEQMYHKQLIDTTKVKEIAQNFQTREDSPSLLLFYTKMWNLRLFILSELALYDQFLQGLEPQSITTTVTTVEKGEVGSTLLPALTESQNQISLPTIFPVDDDGDDGDEDQGLFESDGEDDDGDGGEDDENEAQDEAETTHSIVKQPTPVKSSLSPRAQLQLQGDAEAISPLSMGDDAPSTEPNTEDSDNNKESQGEDGIDDTVIDQNNLSAQVDPESNHEDDVPTELTKKDFDVMSSTVTVTTESGEYVVIPRNPSGKLNTTATSKKSKKAQKKEAITVEKKSAVEKKQQAARAVLFTPQIDSTPQATQSQSHQPMSVTPGPQSTRGSVTAVIAPVPVTPQIQQQQVLEPKTTTTTTTTTTTVLMVTEPQFGQISQAQIHTLSILATYTYIQMVKHSLSTYTYGCQYLTLLSSSQSTLDQMTHGLFSTLPANQLASPFISTPLNPVLAQPSATVRPSSSASQQQPDDSANVFNYHSLFFKPIPIPMAGEMEGVLYRVSQLSTSENTYNALTVQNTAVLDYIGTTVSRPYQPHIIALYQHLCEVIISPDHEVRKIVLKLLLALRYKMGNGIF